MTGRKSRFGRSPPEEPERIMKKTTLVAALAGTLLAVSILPAPATAQERPTPAGRAAQPDFPAWSEVSEGFKQASTHADGGLYNLWVRERDGQVLAELPRGWANQKHLIAMTVPRGQLFAGLQAGERYVYWKRFDKRIALMEPNLDVRSTGDPESRAAIQHHFTDRVLIDIPIRSMGPNGQPVIDLTNLLVGNASTFYGRLAERANTRLVTVSSAKAFPQNIEISFELPVGPEGRMHTFHYSISNIPERTGYRPREADERVGYFTVSYRDFGKFKHDEVWKRYIRRWHIEKRDPKLRMSPAKEPIVFYVEHTTPPRYRRWVREGVLYWNKAFEQVGILDAIEVYYQDAQTGAHMDKDPEDVRYNFIRWLSNDIGTAIGPSRSHPVTGQILSADIVLTDGWIRHFWHQANEVLPQIAMEGMSPETVAWLEQNPEWDPRVRLTPPEQREQMLHERARRGIMRFGGQALPSDPALASHPELMELADIVGSMKLCMASNAKAMDMALMGLSLDVLGLIEEEWGEPPADTAEPATGDAKEKKDEEKEEDKADTRPRRRPAQAKDETDLLDGIPEWFVGPMLADLVAHEVGHTLGLRHNFKASAAYTLEQINSEEWKGKRPISASVMDYTPVNINMNPERVQGDHHVRMVGPYDMWAIEYGYTLDDPKKVLKRVNEPELAYATDEDANGPDPLARRYDFSAEPREYAEERIKLVNFLRERILDKFVKDGESWSKARRGYHITLNAQTDSLNIMANWLGGSFVNRARKGDPGDRAPIEPVPAEQQRAALRFIIENSFYDHAFGLTPDLLQRMTVDKWLDGGSGSPYAEPTWAVHDRIMGIQASALTWLLNPTTLRRIYDNEFIKGSEVDALTLPELLEEVTLAVWNELDANSDRQYTPRDPMISSLRRSLQREHLERMIDLSMGTGAGASRRPVANLATMQLREMQGKIAKVLERKDNRADAYSRAHLAECKLRIEKALDAQYIYNQASGRGGMFGGFIIGAEGQAPAPTPHVEPRWNDGEH